MGKYFKVKETFEWHDDLHIVIPEVNQPNAYIPNTIFHQSKQLSLRLCINQDELDSKKRFS